MNNAKALIDILGGAIPVAWHLTGRTGRIVSAQTVHKWRQRDRIPWPWRADFEALVRARRARARLPSARRVGAPDRVRNEAR